MVMEPMNEGSLGVREGVEKGKMRSGLRGRVGDTLLGKRKRGEGDRAGGGLEAADEAAAGTAAKPEKKARKKGPKGPNPLSVKKSKKPTQASGKPDGGVEVAEEPGPTQDTEGMSVANAQPESTKRKRKRKHRSKTSDENIIRENGDIGDSA